MIPKINLTLLKAARNSIRNATINNLKILNASFRKNFSRNKDGQETYEPIFRVARDAFSKIPFLDANSRSDPLGEQDEDSLSAQKQLHC